ncbi:uncharacterized protein LOC110975549 [Acanthaster planci]|uniref:Uncharacterized protein LOC110975549 n=1 Tax=Acanthaster planci TaxID=133434 RepID=A0A8B7XSH6_ACAPL|nr:uncharacterized protein LOC110975549 [Acanthaster planci]
MACVAKAAFTSRIVWLVVLQYALLVDFSRRTAAAPVPARPNPTNDLGPSTDEEDENQDNPPTYSPEQATDDNSDLEIGSNKCRPCKSSFFRYPGGRRRTGAVAGARRHSTGYRRASSAKSRPCRGLCRPCTICAGGLTVLTNCTATQDTVCSLCREGFTWDPVRGQCRKVNPLIHEVVVEISRVSSPSPLTMGWYDNPTHSHAIHSNRKPVGDATRKNGHAAPSLTEEARNEGMAPGYIASLIASGAAGVAVLILIVVVIIYAVLRWRQWKYSTPRRERTWRFWFESIFKRGSQTVANDAQYSNVRDFETETPLQRDTVTRVESEYLKDRESKGFLNLPAPNTRNDLVVLETALGCEKHENPAITASFACQEKTASDDSFMKRNTPKSEEKQISNLARRYSLFGQCSKKPDEELAPNGDVLDVGKPSNGYAGKATIDCREEQLATAPPALPACVLQSAATRIPTEDAVVNYIQSGDPPLEGVPVKCKETNM